MIPLREQALELSTEFQTIGVMTGSAILETCQSPERVSVYDIPQKGVRKSEGSGDWGELKQVAAGHDRMSALMNSRHLWFPEQEQSNQHSSMEGKGPTRPTSEELLAGDDDW